MENNNLQNQIFTDSQIQNFVGFSNAIKKVHLRLIGEGYIIKNGEVFSPKIVEEIENKEL